MYITCRPRDALEDKLLGIAAAALFSPVICLFINKLLPHPAPMLGQNPSSAATALRCSVASKGKTRQQPRKKTRR